MQPYKPSLLMTADEVAHDLCTSRKVVYELAKQGRLPGVVRLGRSLRFRRARLLEFLGKGEVGALALLEDGAAE